FNSLLRPVNAMRSYPQYRLLFLVFALVCCFYALRPSAMKSSGTSHLAKIAVTGSNGSVGKRVVLAALQRGYQVVGIDHSSAIMPENAENFSFLQVDLKDYEQTLRALEGCQAVIHLAAVPNPADYRVLTHNSNVIISWNVLRAASELGIKRIAQASSVNVLPMVYSKEHRFEFFPIDESHVCLPDEPYGLSKVISELQADTIVRRYPDLRVAS
ncbi:unnamed protein product, partial [Mycena citricolor]